MTGRLAYAAIRRPRRFMPKGGSGMLTRALARYIEAHNGVILLNKPVERLIVEGGKCTGVECVDGDSYRARKAVLSTIHIKQLVDMAPRDLWGEDFLVRRSKPGRAKYRRWFRTMPPPSHRSFPWMAARCRPWKPASCLVQKEHCGTPMSSPLGHSTMLTLGSK